MINALNKIANEAIAFQKISAVGEALDKVFQDVIDYRNSLPIEEQKEKVITYCKTVMKEKLKAAIKNTINLTVEQMIFYTTQPKGIFAIECYSGKIGLFNEARSRVFGDKKITNPSKELQEVINLYKTLDLKTGKFSTTTYGTNNDQIFITLHMDISYAFLLHHYVSPETVDLFTAKELTAIYLHEIGHFSSLIERFRYEYFVMIDIATRVNKLVTNYSYKDIASAFIDKNNELLSTIKDNKDPEVSKMYDLCTKAAHAILYFESKADDSPVIIKPVSIVVKLLAYSLVFIMLGIWKITRFNYLWNAVKSVVDNPLDKTTDMVDTDRRSTMFEKDADEYTVRSGYGEYQASALAKLYQYGNATANSRLNKRLSRLNGIGNILQFSYQVVKNYTKYHNQAPLYEEDIARLERLAQMTIPAFKTLPPELAKQYIYKYENILKIVKSTISERTSSLYTMMTYIDKVTNVPIKFLDALMNNNVSQDYLRLQNQMEELVNNKLYYYGLKLQQLVK